MPLVKINAWRFLCSQSYDSVLYNTGVGGGKVSVSEEQSKGLECFLWLFFAQLDAVLYSCVFPGIGFSNLSVV